MKKLGLLITVASALVLGASATAASHLRNLPERDARIIVEVDKNIKQLSEKGALRTQQVVYDNIKEYATTNIRNAGHYTVLNNAFVLEVNSADIEAIKSVPGVKSVTVDKMHWVQEYNHDSYIPLGGPDNDAIDESKNISAETMHKPEDTNDGEGTIVAILDNEFHFRGNTGNTADRNQGREWHHEVYEPLDNDVAVRYTYDSVGEVIDGGLKAGKRKDGAHAGDEGSMYLNNKVPFYYDYGGYSVVYGKRGKLQYDVHSDLSYHGSHVSSITAANAPEYKGIAPKAQLALMKVFTDYDAKGGIGEKIGLSDRTGAYDTSILDALEDCIRLKVDGINMSLGSDLDDFDQGSITMLTLNRLHDEGILSAISAGNAGKTAFKSTGAYANWMPESVETGILGSYANNSSSTIVASGQPTQIFYENAFVINNSNIAFEDQIVNREGFDDDYDKEFRMKDIYHGQPLEWVYVPGFGTSADYKGLDVSGKVAVVNRGSTAFADKYAVAVDKEACALVIINNDPTASDFNFRCSFGDGFNPTMPCCLVLYKDKGVFEGARSGTFDIINKEVSENPNAYTMSTFSTDGAKFDLDLKPDVTAPGDNIRGAVPEHAMTSLNKEEREEVKNKAYQYLSGTSMSAPNYAGAQALVLSNVTKDIVAAQNARGGEFTEEESDAMDAYRRTVDMRLMSTADPMHDLLANPEQEEETKTITSPRIQGAGMVDLAGALATDVYLEGLDLNNEPIGKSKVALRNNNDIARGDIQIKFLAHNESNEARSYNVTLNVMRPAIAHPNDIVTKDYNYKGQVESIELFTGMKYYDKDLDKMVTVSGQTKFKDAYKVSKAIDYYASKEDYQIDKKTTIEIGYYYNSATDGGCAWEALPSYTAQSVMDVEIARITGQQITLEPGENTVEINQYSLTDEQKNEILAVYEYGCMIEGYVTLESTDEHVDLSIPYLGFYSGTDRDASRTYRDAPVAEPFNFEKDQTQVYPSDLVNDIAKSLIGKDRCNFESMIVAGYAEAPQKIDVDKVLTNDLSFDGLNGFYKVGTDPYDDEYMDDAKNNIYVGSENTNTLIIQQFMLRSVAENNFTITNKETHEVVYKSALEDMLFGDTGDKWTLYKSHVDASYLSAGYVAHRAYAIVPLFDETTGERFASGEYELKFNYQLAYDNSWVSKSYDIHIDSDAPEVTSIAQYKENGVDRVRIYLQDARVSYGVLGYRLVDVAFDQEKGQYYIDETKEFVDSCINTISGSNAKRLFISAVDYARGEIGCVVHFKDNANFNTGYQLMQGTGIPVYMDYKWYADGSISFINTITGAKVASVGDYKFSKFGAALDPSEPDPEPTPEPEPEPTPDSSEAPADSSAPVTPSKSGGCNGAIASVSLAVALPALMGTAVLFFRKRIGGK